MLDIVRSTSRTLDAARILREQIAELAEGDEDFIRDTLEGEIDLPDIIRVLLAGIGEDEAHEAGLKSYIDELRARKERLARRADLKRALIASALEIAGQKRLDTDLATVTLKAVPARPLVTEESEIPALYWKPQPPKLDLSALTSALREGAKVPGATLSNGSQTVQIRRR
jgi:hypothetical protein